MWILWETTQCQPAGTGGVMRQHTEPGGGELAQGVGARQGDGGTVENRSRGKRKISPGKAGDPLWTIRLPAGAIGTERNAEEHLAIPLQSIGGNEQIGRVRTVGRSDGRRKAPPIQGARV